MTKLQSKFSQGYINKIKRIEARARKLENELALAKITWELYHETLVSVYPNDWKTYCNENGLYHNYAFNDILA